MIRRLLFFLCWISAFAQPIVSAQTVDESLLFARQQVNEGDWQLAMKTYQRVLYFGRGQYREECQRQLALLHVNLGNYDKAAFYCDLLYQGAQSDSLRYEALFSKTALLMLQNQYQKALLELLSLPKNLPEAWSDRRQLYLGAAHFGARQFDLAHQDLRPLIDENNPEARKSLERLIRNAKKVSKKSPKTARLLSTFLPGAGQFYAGDLKNGLNSLLLNSLLGYWFISTGVSYTFVDAAATVTPWLFRYYGGGIRRAGEILEKKKEERLRDVFQKILLELETSASD